MEKIDARDIVRTTIIGETRYNCKKTKKKPTVFEVKIECDGGKVYEKSICARSMINKPEDVCEGCASSYFYNIEGNLVDLFLNQD